VTLATPDAIIEQLTVIQQALDTNDATVINSKIDLLERIINRFYKNSSYDQNLRQAKRSIDWVLGHGNGSMGHSVEMVKSILNPWIENMLIETTRFGTPSINDPQIDKSIIINNQHIITQSQIVNIELFKEILKDSLTGKQYKELTDLVKEEKDVYKAAPKILDKLKSFGENVAGNIVANILTNPHFYSSLF
jgi:hypothetical protein